MRKIWAVTGFVTMLLAFGGPGPASAGPQEAERPRGDRYGVQPPFGVPNQRVPSREPLAQVCGRALEERIRSEHPHTDRVELLPRSISEWSYSRSEDAAAGDGRMLRGKSWDDFDFVCLVERRSGRVVALEWSGPLRDDGTPVRPGAPRPSRLLTPLQLDSAAGRGCAEAVVAEIRREHPRSGRVDFERATLRQWRRPQAEFGARGEGHFAGFRGRPHPFEFACLWDARRGVTSAFYELQ